MRIQRIAAGGDGVGRLADGRAVFIPRTAPGDLVTPAGLRAHKRFARARIGVLEERSPDRVEPRCQKRRGKNYPYMIHPRSVLRQRLLDQQPAA